MVHEYDGQINTHFCHYDSIFTIFVLDIVVNGLCSLLKQWLNRLKCVFLYIFRLSASGKFRRSIPVCLRAAERIVCQDGFVVVLGCASLMLRKCPPKSVFYHWC